MGKNGYIWRNTFCWIVEMPKEEGKCLQRIRNKRIGFMDSEKKADKGNSSH